MAEAYIGEVRLFALNYAPVNWMACEGQILAIRQYTALFSLLGVTYGGNGTITFQLPDLRGRAVVGSGNPPAFPGTEYAPGDTGGELTVTLAQNNLPAHTHAMNVCGLRSLATARLPTATSGFAKTTTCTPYLDAGNPPQVQASIFELPPAFTANPVPHDNMAPWITVQYNICINGTFPPRS